jgi:RNA polymerase sigma-70 factor (ECF subfamily)
VDNVDEDLSGFLFPLMYDIRSMPLKIIARNTDLDEQCDETALIEAAQKGDHGAFHDIYDRYRDTIFNLISYSLRDPRYTDDIFQTVFLKVYQALPSFRRESSFLTWIYQIALNECKNANREKTYWTSLSDIFRKPEELDPGPTPDIAHSANDQSRLVQLAISKLKPKYREIVILKYHEELSYEEIAAILSISSGTVASRLHRALKILESLL